MSIFAKPEVQCKLEDILNTYKVLRASRSTGAFGKNVQEALDCSMYFMHELAKQKSIDPEYLAQFDAHYNMDYKSESIMVRDEMMEKNWGVLDKFSTDMEWGDCTENLALAKKVLDYFKPITLPIFIPRDVVDQYEAMIYKVNEEDDGDLNMDLESWTVYSGLLPDRKTSMEITVTVRQNDRSERTWVEFTCTATQDGRQIHESVVDSDNMADTAEVELPMKVNHGMDDAILVTVVPMDLTDLYHSVKRSLSFNRDLLTLMKKDDVEAIIDKPLDSSDFEEYEEDDEPFDFE